MSCSLSEAEAWELFYRAGCPAWVEAHVTLVHEVATDFASRAAQKMAIDQQLVAVGAILHDVGRAQTQDPTHAYLGATWLRKQGVEEEICLIVERHTGAGLLAAEAASFGLPERDFVPVTLEEKLVAHADNLCSGPNRVNMEFLRKKYTAQGLEEPFSRIEVLHQEVMDLTSGS